MQRNTGDTITPATITKKTSKILLKNWGYMIKLGGHQFENT